MGKRLGEEGIDDIRTSRGYDLYFLDWEYRMLAIIILEVVSNRLRFMW